ncbi:MAG: DinB family protein [Planctomycetota bacterium]|nr:DinB family protein [Planctomycetota bacterium]
MPAEWPWFERHFSFDYPIGKRWDILDRLRGAPVRVEDKVRGLGREALTRRDGEGWSIQENIGHLSDLESLHDARLTELLAGAAVLTAADVTNARTHGAGHNARTIEEVVGEFRRVREAFLARLEALEGEQFALTALHPRLKQPMRVVDVCCFCAEHDDYHLARIEELRRKFAAV